MRISFSGANPLAERFAEMAGREFGAHVHCWIFRHLEWRVLLSLSQSFASRRNPSSLRRSTSLKHAFCEYTDQNELGNDPSRISYIVEFLCLKIIRFACELSARESRGRLTCSDILGRRELLHGRTWSRKHTLEQNWDLAPS